MLLIYDCLLNKPAGTAGLLFFVELSHLENESIYDLFKFCPHNRIY